MLTTAGVIAALALLWTGGVYIGYAWGQMDAHKRTAGRWGRFSTGRRPRRG